MKRVLCKDVGDLVDGGDPESQGRLKTTLTLSHVRLEKNGVLMPEILFLYLTDLTRKDGSVGQVFAMQV